MSDRIVLAYSGGLDTSVCIGWLAEETGQEVVAVAVDVGQGGEDLDVIRQRALDCGAVESVVVDARDEFADDFCLPALRANARGNAMDFDPEIAVGIAWAGAPVLNLTTRVRYLSQEQGGVSHFRMWRDNVLISWMHTRMVLALLFRIFLRARPRRMVP